MAFFRGDADSVASGLFGGVHGGVGGAQRRVGVGGLDECHSDAGGDAGEWLSVEVDGPPDDVEDAAGQVARCVEVPELFADDDELVAAEATDQVGGAKLAREGVGLPR